MTAGWLWLPVVVADRGMPNTSGKDRRAIIMGWLTSASRSGPCLTEGQAAKLEAGGRMTEVLRQLAGLA